MGIVNGFDAETGERVFIKGNSEACKAFWEDVFASEVGQRFSAKFKRRANIEIIEEALGRLYPAAEHTTTGMMIDTLRTLMLSASDRLVPLEPQTPETPEEPAAAPVPVDKNGRALSESQIRWSEYRQFAEAHSSKECRERARSDAGFASFVRKNLEREMAEAGGMGETASAPTTAEATPELRQFAADYQGLQSSEVRRLLRSDCNPLGCQQFRKDRDAAIAAGLL